MTTAQLNQLRFDSDLFGFTVAAARFDTAPDASTLDRLIGDARTDGVCLLYLMTQQPVTTPAGVAAGFGSVKVTWYQSLDAVPANPVPITKVSIDPTEPVPPDLLALAFGSGHQSRFRLDPLIPTRVFETLYQTWIRRSLTGEIADVVLVSDDGGTAGGLITVGRHDERTAEIGLLAVAEACRGRGLGRRLVDAALRWAADSGFERINVATQGDNDGACALYQRTGFHRGRTEHILHLWLDPVTSSPTT